MMKRLMALVLALMLLLSTAPGVAEATVLSSGDFRYVLLEDGTAKIVDCLDRGESVVVPEMVDGVQVSTIGERAFGKCFNTTRIELPGNLTTVESNAFENCFVLEEVSVVQGSAAEAALREMGLNVVCRPGPEQLYGYTVLPDGTAEITSYSGQDTELIIPAALNGYPVSGIGDKAFSDNKSLSRVVLPDTVTRIGYAAFGGCTALTEIVLSRRLERIDRYAFESCALRSIHLPASLTTIGQGVFAGYETLAEITVEPGCEAFAVMDGALVRVADMTLLLYPAAREAREYTTPQGIVAIGEEAFRFNGKLERLTIGEGVRTVGSLAIDDMPNLKSISLPASLEKMDIGSCPALEEIVVAQGNPMFAVMNDALVNTRAMELLCVPAARINGEYAVPDGIRSIRGTAFANYTDLTGISFPESLEFIGDSSFSRTGLRNVSLPEGLKQIGNLAFAECSDAVFTVPAGSYAESWCKRRGVTYTAVEPEPVAADTEPKSEFVWSAFDDGTVCITKYDGPGGVVKIPAELDGRMVTALGANLFADNQDVTEVVVPDGVKNINTGIFSNCSNLRKVTLPQYMEKIDSFAFRDCTALEEIVMPIALTRLAGGAFRGCTSLRSITLPEGIQYVDGSMFHSCTSLTSVVVPQSVGTIFDEAFANCRSLTSIQLPSALIRIGNGAFAECTALTDVTLPDGLARIGNRAFENCTALTRVNLPDSLAEIGDHAFAGCPQLEAEVSGGFYGEKYCAENGIRHRVLSGIQNAPDAAPASDFTWEERSTGVIITGYTGKGGRVVIPATIENKPVIAIGENVFNWNSAVTAVVLPGTVKTIREDAFHGCQNMQELVLPEGLECIEDSAFAYCGALKTVTLPASLRDVGVGVFSNDRRLEEIVVAPGNDVFTVTDGALINAQTGRLLALPSAYPGNTYVTPSGVTEIAYRSIQASNKLERLVISEGVQRIESDAIVECENLKVLELPASLVTLELPAMFECEKITDIRLAEGNPNFRLCDGALVRNADDELVIVPRGRLRGEYTVPDGVRSIGQWVLEDTDLRVINLPASVKDVGSYAFSAIPNLQPVALPAGMTRIPDGLFSDSGITSVELPKGVESIGYAAFLSTNISRIELPASLRELDGYAFSECDKLTEIVLPDGVETLAYGVFEGCDKLETVILPASVTYIGQDTFSSCPALTVYAPAGSYAETYCKQNGVKVNAVTVTAAPTQTPAATPAPNAADFAWMRLTNGGVEIIEYKGKGGVVEVPSLLGGRAVTSIGNYAFNGCDKITRIVLPDTVTRIGDFAFSDCTKLTEIVLPEGLETIGMRAFQMCEKLKTVHLPAGVRSLGEGVFAWCRSMESITVDPGNPVLTVQDDALVDVTSATLVYFPNAHKATEYITPAGVEHIGESAFYSNKNLKRVVISEGVTTIGVDAFQVCERLETLELPSTLMRANGTFCTSCDRLKNIVVAEGNPVFTLVDYMLIDTAQGELIGVAYARLTKDFTVPDGVRRIGDFLLDGVDVVRSIYLPDSVEEVGDYAFCSMNRLRTVRLPAGLKEISCGMLAYSGIETIELPENLRSIDSIAFHGCSSLKSLTLPATVQEIGNEAFDECPRLVLRVLPGTYAEEYCIIHKPNYEVVEPSGGSAAPPATSSVEDFLWEILDDRTLRLTKYVGNGGVVVIPGEVLGSAVTEVGSDAFMNNQDVTEVVVPEGVQVIDGGAFTGCSNLRKVTLPRHMDSIGYSAFRDCTALEEVVMPVTLRRLAGQVFEKCRSLKSITLPEGIKFIDSKTFYFCTSLESIVVPEGVERILGYAFAYCRSLTSVELPSTLTELGDSVFAECSVLPFVTLPDGLERIGNRTFENCPELFRLNLTGPLKEIGDRAFAICPKLVVEVPDESYAQQYCFKYNVNMVVLPDGGGSGAPEAAPESDFVWETLEDGSACITGYEGNGGEVIVPDALGGCPVTAIGAYAFSGNEDITRVVLPQGIRSIGLGAFSSCEGLEEIVLPDGLEAIGGDVFYWCRALKSIRLPAGLRSLGAGCFSYCPALTEIAVDPANPVFIVADGAVVDTSTRTLLAYPPAREATEFTTPAGVEIIAKYTFEGCGRLQHVVVAEGVREIGMNAFACCDGLVDISLPSTFTDATGPFLYGCYALKDITVHADNPVYAVVDHALYNTRDAELVFLPYSQVGREFTVPEGTRSIGAFVFDGYTNLEVIHLPRSLERVGDYALSNIMYLQPLALPEGVREIGEGAFAGSGMTGVTLPVGLETIGRLAFMESKLETIIVPEGVTVIGDSAFYFCGRLTEITLPASVESIGEDAFAECPQLTLRVPDGSYAARYCIENGLNCVIE